MSEISGAVELKGYQVGEMLCAVRNIRLLAIKAKDEAVRSICDSLNKAFLNKACIVLSDYPEQLRVALLKKMLKYKEADDKVGKKLFNTYKKMVREYQVIAFYLMKYIRVK